jgi:hypothetical protein
MTTQTVVSLSFFQLFQHYTVVEIPMIQRDYAQGRSNAQEVRDGILKSFDTVFQERINNPKFPSLNLDFIFGDIIEQGGSKKFRPLDGQQRLTTLFLLHWYFAWKENHQTQFISHFAADNKSKFSYIVRTSSTDFFNQLVMFQPNDKPQALDTISTFLLNQSWFFLSWSNDPTIKSALTMLDAIHEKFKGSDNQGIYNLLTSDASPIITFQLLELKGFGLSDDLYIKMNARGKPLTTFENTKAKIEQTLILNPSWKFDNNSMHHHFSHNIESNWADLLWKFRDVQTNVYDVQFMQLFRNIMIVAQNVSAHEYKSNYEILRDDKKNELSFQRYHDMNLVTAESFRLLFSVLNHWSKLYSNQDYPFVTTPYFKEEDYIDLIFKTTESLSYEQFAIFYAYIAYVGRFNINLSNDDKFKNWIRIITNLARNTIYNRPEELASSIQFINNILPYAADTEILQLFSNLHNEQSNNWSYSEKTIKGSFNEQQIREEKLKAQLLLYKTEWHELITVAESHKYFAGQIEFLFVFSGVFDEWANAQMSIQWDAEQDTKFRTAFTRYYTAIISIINDSGLIPSLKEYEWERALLTKGNYLSPTGTNGTGSNKHLLLNQDRSFDWKRLLRSDFDHSDKRHDFVKAVLDDLDHTNAVKSLRKIIKSANLDDIADIWRRMLIQEQMCIKYCDNRQIRILPNEPIYLLKRKQLNGEHVELYSYFYYKNIIESLLIAKKDLLPFENHKYGSASNLNEIPHIELSTSDTNTHPITLTISAIRATLGSFTLQLIYNAANPARIGQLTTKHKFTHTVSNPETGQPLHTFTKDIIHDTLISELKKLCKSLQS